MKADNKTDGVIILTGLLTLFVLRVSATPPVTDGLKLWLDASVTASIITNENGLVYQWNDLSGAGNHVAQSTDYRKPIYNPQGFEGLPSLSFNGTNVIYRSGGLICYSNHTVFLVAKATSFNENDMLGSGGTSAGDILVMHYKSNGNFVYRGHYWAASSMVSKDSAINTTVSAPMVFVHRMGSEGLEIFRNGSRDAIQPFNGALSTNLKGIIIGYRSAGGSTGKCFAGEMSEVLIYDKTLSNAERIQVETYLYNKWNIPCSTEQVTPVTDGLCFRADASVRQTVITDDEDKIIQWRDLSGSGRHLQHRVDVVPTNQPSYTPIGFGGKPSVSFNGTNVLLTTANTINYSNHTVFVVAKPTDVTSLPIWGNDIIGAGSDAENCINMNIQNGLFSGSYWITNGSPVTLRAETVVTFTPTLYEQCLDDENFQIFRNGLLDGSSPVESLYGTLRGITLGYRNQAVSYDYGFIGDISEVLIYDRALSDEERQQVENHLTNKWFAVSAMAVPVTRNLKFWVDASDSSLIETNMQGKVSKWLAQGGTGYFVKQSNVAKQPVFKPEGLNHHPSIYFNGSNVMSLPFYAINYSNHTVFVVAKADSVTANDILGSGGISNGDILVMNYQNKYRGHYFPSSTGSTWVSLDSSTPSILEPVIYEQVLNNSSMKIYRTGQLDGSHAGPAFYVNDLRSVVLGSRNASDYFIGEMSEVLIYDCALTDEERQQVEKYLYNKWLRDLWGTLIMLQ